MNPSPLLINLFLLTKLPSAYFCGVRVGSISKTKCTTVVTHRWINQNPFGSMYFAVQAMAAELSTGAIVFSEIKNAQAKVSMLVVAHESRFFKKATGQIAFTCSDGDIVSQAIQKAISTGEGQLIWLKSHAINQQGEPVSEMAFQWSIKAKQQ